MKTYQKLVLDRIIGNPLVLCTNILARILGFILQRNHSLKEEPRRVIISKMVGMGSIVQSTSLLMTLKKNYPQVQIAYLSARGNQTLLKEITLVDRVISIDDSSVVRILISTWKAVVQCWKFKPDIYIDLELYSNFSSILSSLSLAKNRLGYYRKDQSIRLGIYTHMLYFNLKVPVNQVYLQMARLVGCRDILQELFRFQVSEATLKSASDKIRAVAPDFSLTGRFILINPNASDLRVERRWPKENFASMVNELSRQFPDMDFVFIGSLDEQNYVTSVISEISAERKEKTVNTAGLINVKELLGLISRATLIITNDTGPMHLAFALQVRTLALFGPCSPVQYGNSSSAVTIYKEVYCSPCVHEFLIPPCLGDNQCMKMITVKEVVSSAVQILNNEAAFDKHRTTIQYMNNRNEFPLGVVTRKKLLV